MRAELEIDGAGQESLVGSDEGAIDQVDQEEIPGLEVGTTLVEGHIACRHTFVVGNLEVHRKDQIDGLEEVGTLRSHKEIAEDISVVDLVPVVGKGEAAPIVDFVVMCLNEMAGVERSIVYISNISLMSPYVF